uniref:Metal-dependent transcriptional regulator n=1 Tax=candidate division WOR-3 bacterium TaxID=2052148 RepID=A0A7C3NAV3_UNCW3
MKKLSKSLEDYIEAIYIASNGKDFCRVKDIQKILNVSKPSIVNALSILKEDGLISQEKYGYISLTKDGERKAKNVYKKHMIITEFVEKIFELENVDAQKIACEIEHIVDKNIYERMEKISKNFNERTKRVLYGEKDETDRVKGR